LIIGIIVLMAMIALAVDIGLLASARAQAQALSDLAALAGARQLNGDTSDSTNANNVNAALSTAKNRGADNKIFNQAVTTAMINAKSGIYTYDSTLERFVASYPSSPGSNAWSVIQVATTTTMPTYFGRVFGMNSFNVKALATAAHRPRDIALILDYSGSMRFGCQTGYPASGDYTGSLNPDPVYPKFGHYSTMASVMQRTTDYVDSGGETHAVNNLTMDTTGGTAFVQDFLTRDSGGNLVNAFVKSPFSITATPVCTPAPNDWDLQSSTTATYAGDKWPLKSMATSGTNWAATVQEYFTGTNTAVANSAARSTTNGPGGAAFDPRLTDVFPYVNNGYGPTFKGYVMGPGYYGKTFFVWPPDPRTPGGNPGDISPVYVPGDWRKRFFYKTGTTTAVDDNSVLFDSAGMLKQAGTSGAYDINYNAVIKWLKHSSQPQVLPPNLRAGRIVYYSAIPDTIPNSGGTLDQVFWREYIKYVIGAGTASEKKRSLYGWQTTAWGTAKITAKSLLTGSPQPYMHYNDNPLRPRLHFWFGPLSMMTFITADNSGNSNMWPGTVHESQSWVLKAGVNSALEDIRKNHPNDWACEIFFSDANSFATPRVTLGRDYSTMRNALFFPFSLLSSLGDANAEIRPYDTSFTYNGKGDIPNANGGTTPEMAFKAAYNQFSGASGYSGRHGALKVVIFETDGVPNTLGDGTFVNGGAYKSYFNSIGAGTYLGNNDATVVSRAVAAVSQICALDSAGLPGYSSTRNPARVHAIAFGNLFESGSSLRGTALDFLAQVQVAGNTSPSGTDGTGYESTEPYKVIIGDSTTRVDKIRQALERIMQSGVQVSLIQ